MNLNSDSFKQLVQNGILFSIDLVVLDHQSRILVGKRVNRPAQGSWFVPGGRVYKNEPLPKAFKRICLTELGQEFDYPQAWLLGLYDHFYKDSVFGEDISTHYVNAPYLIKLEGGMKLEKLPKYQHQDYRWLSINEIEQEDIVHPYSKVFIDALKETLQRSTK